MENIYLHSINTTGYIADIDGSIDCFEKILDTGAILTRHSLGLAGVGFNGTRHISLSDYDLRYDHIYKNNPVFYDYSAYEMYSKKAISVAFPKESLSVIHPNLIPPLDNSFFSFLRFFGASKDMINQRITDLPDEVQVKGGISLSNACGVTIPVNEIAKNIGISKVKDVFKKIKMLLEKYEYLLKVYDVESLDELENEKEIDEIVKRSY